MMREILSRRIERWEALPAAAQSDAVHLSGRDVAMGRVYAAMVAFGCVVGALFPWLASAFVEIRPGDVSAFRLSALAAGLGVGLFACGVARLTLYRANRRLVVLAARDGLTGLLNHSMFHDVLDRELARAARSGGRVSLLVIDLDDFKSVNDRHGHLLGDRVLRSVAWATKSTLRQGDVACRVGGEEFAVILPEAARAAAVLVAERIRARLEGGLEAALPRVTASIGVAVYPDDAASSQTLLECADAAMYAGKAEGRNRVCGWDGVRRLGLPDRTTPALLLVDSD